MPERMVCDVAMSREPTMSPAHDPPYDTDREYQDPIAPHSITTAVQVVVAWLIAFVSIALLALL